VKAVILIVALGLGSCTLGDERVSRSCKIAADCFQAQGERCNTTTNECELVPDAGALETEDEALTTDVEIEAEAHHE
jgi:hypothetical protein